MRTTEEQSLPSLALKGWNELSLNSHLCPTKLEFNLTDFVPERGFRNI